MKITSCDCIEHNSFILKKKLNIETVSPFLIEDNVCYRAYIIYKTKGIINPTEVQIPIDYCPFCGKKIEIGE